MKAWFKISPLQQKAGKITDVYANYVELYCEETNEYYIRRIDEIEIIKKV